MGFLEMVLGGSTGLVGILASIVVKAVVKSINTKREAILAHAADDHLANVKSTVLDLAGVFVEETYQTFVRPRKAERLEGCGAEVVKGEHSRAFERTKGNLVKELEHQGLAGAVTNSFLNAAIETAVLGAKAAGKVLNARVAVAKDPVTK